ncbi:transglutaminaseTgpA domain-containing protein [Nocardioides sp. Leaf374]|uniref:transglutaminase family protein n=1 Tax=Nocardioides sp. Leaf374 TaxID=2876560 RepID=UPI001E3E261C|nr:DUF3488 and transglutaminase-like domain-containing protein [Nocardioides sp. Leaf374]
MSAPTLVPPAGSPARPSTGRARASASKDPRARGAGRLLLSALAATLTTWAAVVSWRGLTETPGGFLRPLLLLALVVAGTGALARLARLPALVVLLAQTVVGVALASELLIDTPVPLGAGWSELVRAVEAAVATSRQYAAPVPPEAAPLDPLLVGGGLACMLLVDLLANGVRRVPLAGLPLLTVYAVPVSIVDSGLSWWVFALTAAGFLVMLFLQEDEQVARWGRPLDERGRPTEASDTDLRASAALGPRSSTSRVGAASVGAAATALAVLVPLGVPTLDVDVFSLGAGGAGGDDAVQIVNPMTDLQRDLRRGSDIPLLEVQTDDPDPSYLRIAVLNRFSSEAWSSGDREIPTDNLPDGAVPALQGVAGDVARRSYDYDVSIGEDFQSRWLPTWAPIRAIRAEGDWRYDESTMDFLASADDLDTAGLDYSMTGVELDLSAAQLASAPSAAGAVSAEMVDLPPLPDLVRDLAVEVTAEAPTRYAKAVALQNWFRSEFTYDLARADEGNGVSELEAFLRDDEGGRVGYCEQFASAMAVMARELDIPARVAVGFLRPDEIGPDRYQFSAYDLHAWPELFIAGAGWVRFEPTPADRAAAVPDYTRGQLDSEPDQPSAQPSEQSQAPVQPDRPAPSAEPEVPQAQGPDDTDTTATTFPWAPVAGGVGGLLALGALLLLPRLLRGRRRERWLAAGPEGVWQELRATALDLGHPWPEQRSVRTAGAALLDWYADPAAEPVERPERGAAASPEAAAATRRLVTALERLRYAPAGSTDSPAASEQVGDDGRVCVAALLAGVTPRQRRAARWWPRSVLTAGRRPSGAQARRAEVRATRTGAATVDEVG